MRRRSLFRGLAALPVAALAGPVVAKAASEPRWLGKATFRYWRIRDLPPVDAGERIYQWYSASDGATWEVGSELEGADDLAFDADDLDEILEACLRQGAAGTDAATGNARDGDGAGGASASIQERDASYGSACRGGRSVAEVSLHGRDHGGERVQSVGKAVQEFGETVHADV